MRAACEAPKRGGGSTDKKGADEQADMGYANEQKVYEQTKEETRDQTR